MQFGFNSGAAFMIAPGANPTPDQLGVLQSASLSLKSTNKKLYGQGKLPVAAGVSQIDVTGKAKFAQYQARLINDFFGSTMAAGQTLISYSEAANIPATSPYTVSPANHTTLTLNLGVIYASTGIPFVCVASSPTVGQYSVASGVYTFAAADEGVAVQITYEYTATTSGETITISNSSAGAASLSTIVLGMQYNGLQGNFTLSACLPTDLSVLDSKLGDFSMPELSFDAICNAAGILGTISLAEAS